MKRLTLTALALALAAFLIPAARGQEKADAPVASPGKVLVELYTSQGCDSCPPAADLVGRLEKLGHGPDRLAVLNFHVDYFNTPWVDPFSDPSFSRRQMSYNEVKHRTDLYFTPLLMVDGRYPMLGSDQPKALTALARARKEKKPLALDMALKGDGRRKSLTVKLGGRGEADGRELLVGVALTEDSVTTKVPSGENAGKTLVEYNVVRRFTHKFVKGERGESSTLVFTLDLDSDWEPGKFQVVAFAQDRLNGVVYRADSIPWVSPKAAGPSATRVRDIKNTIAIRKDHHAQALKRAGAMTVMIPASSLPTGDDSIVYCPDCSSLFSPKTLIGLPPGINVLRGVKITVGPGPSC